MSDFDKEAEREKLRKKYEREKQDREATRRMSDLLLKGATMTNTHCGTCGDPLFRQNGVTFCPTCHGSPDAVEGSGLEDAAEADADADEVVDEASAEAESAVEAASEAEAADDAEAGATTGSRAATESTAGEDEPADEPAAGEDEPADASSTPSADADASRTVDERVARHATAPRRAPPSQRSAGREERAGKGRYGGRTGRRSSPSAEADVGGARESLVESLEYFAREAAETDDPRYARDCLEAAREAAETLAILGR